MEAQNSHYHFGGGAGNALLPAVSAFSAYNLLRSCNYLLTPQVGELQSTHRLPPTVPRIIVPERPDCTLSITEDGSDIEKPFFNLPNKSHVTSGHLLGYSHHIHNVLQSEQISSRSSSVVSPSSSMYSSNFRRQRGEKKPIPEEQKDEKYFERRRRNNQAAKKSRDARKMREDHIALKATILEHENAILRAQVLTLREETSSLRQLLLQKKTLELTAQDTISRS